MKLDVVMSPTCHNNSPYTSEIATLHRQSAWEILCCGKVSGSYLTYFLRYDVLLCSRQTDRLTETYVYEPIVGSTKIDFFRAAFLKADLII